MKFFRQVKIGLFYLLVLIGVNNIMASDNGGAASYQLPPVDSPSLAFHATAARAASPADSLQGAQGFRLVHQPPHHPGYPRSYASSSAASDRLTDSLYDEEQNSHLALHGHFNSGPPVASGRLPRSRYGEQDSHLVSGDSDSIVNDESADESSDDESSDDRVSEVSSANLGGIQLYKAFIDRLYDYKSYIQSLSNRDKFLGVLAIAGTFKICKKNKFLALLVAVPVILKLRKLQYAVLNIEGSSFIIYKEIEGITGQNFGAVNLHDGYILARLSGRDGQSAYCDGTKVNKQMFNEGLKWLYSFNDDHNWKVRVALYNSNKAEEFDDIEYYKLSNRSFESMGKYSDLQSDDEEAKRNVIESIVASTSTEDIDKLLSIIEEPGYKLSSKQISRLDMILCAIIQVRPEIDKARVLNAKTLIQRWE
ncbi:MAG: hypothetical protein P4L22_03025 [Candidatus Babeliales bacterium]|nr:hypothetical protein [Candidatus Babeliales bacterium]